MNVKDPTEPRSFSIAELIRALPPALRVALVRGAHDPRRPIDSAMVTAGGGSRLRYTVVPLWLRTLPTLHDDCRPHDSALARLDRHRVARFSRP